VLDDAFAVNSGVLSYCEYCCVLLLCC